MAWNKVAPKYLPLRLNWIWLALPAVALAVATRALWFGHGTYQLYIDPGIPPQRLLLLGECRRQMELWSSINFGTRVIYPSSYALCGAITGLLYVGVPAAVISRELVPVCVLAGTYGMFVLLRPPVTTVTFRSSVVVSATATSTAGGALAQLGALSGALLYGLSPFVFNEAVASHVYYLVGAAVVPWAMLAIERWRGPLGVVIVGVLAAVAYTQLQFVVLMPVAGALGLIGLGRMPSVRRFIGGCAIGLIAELPWVIPLLLYPAHVSVLEYVIPGTARKFSDVPWNAVRLVGYVTPFFERSLSPFATWWSAGAIVVLAIALMGQIVLTARLKRKAVPIWVAEACVLLYVWGARGAPGYHLWSRWVPEVLAGLFRERYGLLYILAVLASICVAAAVAAIVRESRIVGLLVTTVVVLTLVGPWASGGMGKYAVQRATFNGEELVARALERMPPGAILTLPPGSVVRGPRWLEYGRNPFVLGVADVALDTEGSPSASALEQVQALVYALGTTPGCSAILALRQVGVRYVVWARDLTGDTRFPTAAVVGRLYQCGFKPVLNVAGVQLLESRISPVGVLRRTSIVDVEPSTGTTLQSLPKSSTPRGREAGAAGVGVAAMPWTVPKRLSEKVGVNVEEFSNRPVEVSLRKGEVKLVEPVAIFPRRGRAYLATLSWEGVVPSTGTWVLPDGAPVTASGVDQDVSGSVTTIDPGRIFTANISAASLRKAALQVQRVGALSAPEKDVVVSATEVQGSAIGTLAIRLVARGVEAGLPVQLPAEAGAYYDVHALVKVLSGPSLYMALVSGGRGHVATSSIGTVGKWLPISVAGVVPTSHSSVYLYFYQPSHGQGTAMSEISSVSVMISERVRGRPTMLHPEFQVGSWKGALAKVAWPGLTPQVSVTQANLAADAHDLQNTTMSGVQGKEVVAAKVSTGGGVELSARRGTAGIPVAVPPGSALSVEVVSRSVSGPPPELRLVDAEGQVGLWRLPQSRQYRATVLRIPLGYADVGDYLYVLQPSPGVSEVRSLSLSIGTEASALVPDLSYYVAPRAGHMVVVRRPTSLAWEVFAESYSPYFSVPGSVFEYRLPVGPATVGGEAWLVPSASKVMPEYAPESLFKVLVFVAWILLGSMLVGTEVRVWSKRRAERS